MSLFDKIKNALKKTSSTISLAITGKKVDAEFLENLRDALILADVGVQTSDKLIEALSKQKFAKEMMEEDVKNILASNIEGMLVPYEKTLFTQLHSPEIVLMVGVNGNGKTTTVAKLANLLKKSGHRPMLVAGDTFRAAAVSQLEYWSQKVGVDICKGKDKSDAAGLVYGAIEKAKTENYDVVLIDTAGRMQNRSDLLDELKKIKRVIQKLDESAPHSTILVLDGLTGQAAHSQVEIFKNEIGVDGIIITKLDATAKGGALVSLTQKYNVPVSYIGVGENVEDLQTFSASQYARALVGISVKPLSVPILLWCFL